MAPLLTGPELTSVAGEPISETEAERLATLLQALGDPTRLRILTALESVCVPVSAIVAATGLSQPTVSHHLRVLRDRGLVRAQRRGSYVYYCTEGAGLRAALDALSRLDASQQDTTPPPEGTAP
jgi:DNA-binding transcriptional ArsR family regulator